MAIKGKPTVVIDTNLFISSIISGGTPLLLLQSWQEDQFDLIISKELLNEIEEVFSRAEIRGKYQMNSSEIDQILIGLKLNAQFVGPLQGLELPVHSRDPKDDLLLATALAGEADYLITGDQDLLVLNGDPKLGKLKIVSVQEFLKT